VRQGMREWGKRNKRWHKGSGKVGNREGTKKRDLNGRMEDLYPSTVSVHSPTDHPLWDWLWSGTYLLCPIKCQSLPACLQSTWLQRGLRYPGEAHWNRYFLMNTCYSVGLCVCVCVSSSITELQAVLCTSLSPLSASLARSLFLFLSFF
jgi:hypothetical protein